jgi:16S rRNA processing protein RimM
MSTAADRSPDGPGPLIAVGRVGPARGVRGAVFVEPWTDVPDERFADGALLRTDPDPGSGHELRVESANSSSGKLVVQFDGVHDRAGAEALRGTTLFIDPADRPPLDDPDEFYDTDLVGLAARTVDGTDLGPVRDVLHASGAVYLVVEIDGQDRLIPFVTAVVPTVDLAGGRVVVDPPPGLLEL